MALCSDSLSATKPEWAETLEALSVCELWQVNVAGGFFFLSSWRETPCGEDASCCSSRGARLQ